jgi:signal transduction histidine kinase
MEMHPWRILLMEDDESEYARVREWLSSFGRGEFILQRATSFEIAFRILEEENVDAILIDYEFEHKKGLEFVQKAISMEVQVPIIMLTGRGDYALDIQAMDAGASDFLSKGEVTPQLLERTIRYAIERRKTEDALRSINSQLECVNEELEDRVQERTRELVRKNAAIMTEVIQRQKIEQELAEVQRRLLDRVEAERLQLSQDLHDGPIQELYAIALQLSGLIDKTDKNDVRNEIVLCERQLQKVIRSLRSTAGELRPPTLTPFGLEKAIRAHAEEFSNEHPSTQLHLDLMPDDNLLTERVRVAFFRIYQAALVNISRHAQASQVNIRFFIDNQTIRLEITDNGCGFIVPERWISFARKGHLGLVGAAERAEAIGAQLNVESVPGKGTRLVVSVPCDTTQPE